MRFTILSSAWLVASVLLVLATHAVSEDGELRDEVSVAWKGDVLSSAILAESLPDALRSSHSEESAEALAADVIKQLERYSHWILDNEYAVALSADARVLLITATSRASKRRIKLVEATLLAFDELMGHGDSNLPAGSLATYASTHLQRVVVLVETDGAPEYQALVNGLARLDPELASWANVVSGEPGFSEMRMSSAAWQSEPEGYEIGEVWRTENELVNRLAHLMLFRGYGQQPTWLDVASAWRVEMEVLDTIYCFPYRDEFVGVGDHVGWQNNLKSKFKQRKRDGLRPAEFTAWEPNTWNEDEAHAAWGFVEYLARYKPGLLSAFATEYQLRFQEGYRTTFADGSWRTDYSYVVPIEDQAEILIKLGGQDLFESATEFFCKGKRYKPKR